MQFLDNKLSIEEKEEVIPSCSTDELCPLNLLIKSLIKDHRMLVENPAEKCC
jgi:hypothetical protein